MCIWTPEILQNWLGPQKNSSPTAHVYRNEEPQKGGGDPQDDTEVSVKGLWLVLVPWLSNSSLSQREHVPSSSGKEFSRRCYTQICYSLTCLSIRMRLVILLGGGEKKPENRYNRYHYLKMNTNLNHSEKNELKISVKNWKTEKKCKFIKGMGAFLQFQGKLASK